MLLDLDDEVSLSGPSHPALGGSTAPIEQPDVLFLPHPQHPNEVSACGRIQADDSAGRSPALAGRGNLLVVLDVLMRAEGPAVPHGLEPPDPRKRSHARTT